jgi:hypothetical protein
MMAHGFHPTGLFLAEHLVFGAFPPADTDAYVDVVPPPFEPSEAPMVYVYVVSFDEVSPWPLTPYSEASVFVAVRHGEMEGWFPLTMPVTGRVAMMGGRRRGFPKEMAEVALVETDEGWSGSARQDGKLHLRLDLSALRDAGDGFADPRSMYRGAPIFNRVPPMRGNKVVATTIDFLEEPTTTRRLGQMAIDADSDLAWARLLPSHAEGCFEQTRGAKVLRHGRVAARFVPHRRLLEQGG